MQREPLRLQFVLPIDRRTGDAHAIYIEGQRRQMLVADQQIVEVGGAVLEADHIGVYPVDLHAVEYQLPFKQWPPGDIKPGVVDGGEFLGTVALAQRQLPGVQAQLGEEGDLDITLQYQFTLRAFLDELNDLRFEIVCVECEDKQTQDDSDQQQDDQYCAQRVAVIGLGQCLGKRHLDRPEHRHQHADHAGQSEQCVFDSFHSSTLAE